MNTRAVLSVAFVLLAGAAWGQEPNSAERGKLAGAPLVTKTAAGHEVSFTLTAPADVTVRIVDADGKVVRHLVSGMVGHDKAAAPLSPGALGQKVVWDGKDDEGKPVDVEGLSAWIGVGMNAKFDRFIGYDPEAFGSIASSGAIAVGPGGRLYLSNHMGVHYSLLRVFDRDGKYVQCLWPFSPALPGVPDLYKSGWGMKDYLGNEVPISVNHAAVYFYVVHSWGIAVNKDGVAAGLRTFGGKGLWVIKGDMPYSGGRLNSAQAPWGKKPEAYGAGGLSAIAAGPEGDFYVVDRGALSYKKVQTGYIVGRLSAPDMEPVNAFEYSGTEKLDQPTYHLGTMDTPGDDESHFQAPNGIAVQADGTILVADAGRIKVFRKDGLFLKRIDSIEAKDGPVDLSKGGQIYLGANWKTGAVYVTASRPGRRTLYKLTSADAPKAVVEVRLDPNAKDVAVDSDADVLWVRGGAGRDTLVRLVDKGDSFESRSIIGHRPSGLCFPRYIEVDGEGRVYVANAGYEAGISRFDPDGKSMILRSAGFGSMPSGSMCADKDGNFYISGESKWAGRSEIWKYDKDGKRVKFADKDAFTVEGDTAYVKGIRVAPNGDIYIAAVSGKGKTLRTPGNYHRKYADLGDQPQDEELLVGRIDIYGPDGTLKKEGIVRLQAPNGLALGRDGSIYTVESYLHHGAQKKDYSLTWGNFKGDRRYRYSLYDKLLKFRASGAQGGEKDAEWRHFGIAGTSPGTCNYECVSAHISIDTDDRVWCHDAAVYNVKALDAAGNLMLRVGVYGNEDCKGGGGDRKAPGADIVVDPEIPLSRPSGVAAWNDFLFITDEFSGRVVRCRLEYTESQQIALR